MVFRRHKIGSICVMLMVSLLIVIPGGGEGAEMNKNIRKPALAGAWYPGDPVTLRSEIENFLEKVPDSGDVPGNIIAMVSPHAGVVYSGQVAAYGFNQVDPEDYDSIIVLGPSHRARFKGAVIFGGEGYETPLGIVPVDRVLADEIVAAGKNTLSFVEEDRTPENSIEIQVPFLQVALRGLPFVPILMGSQDLQTCMNIADGIFASTLDKRVLIVASSDFSHYHGYDRAMKMDSRALEHIEMLDINEFIRCVSNGSCEACGAGPIVVAMMVAQKRNAVGKILAYANSGDVTGDKSGVVGYASVVFYTPDSEVSETGKDEDIGVDEGLSDADKQVLLDIARESISSGLTGEALPSFPIHSPVLEQHRGAFVTLKKRGQLRGCIGFIEGRKPLHETVKEMARAAAFKDPRFRPVTKGEFDDLAIEVSALTPLKKVADVTEIEVGTHGIYIVKGVRSGLLLPQVATEYKWDRMRFLEETCHKAGLPSNAWKDRETAIYIFSADVFGEKD